MILSNHNNKVQEATSVLYKLGNGVNQIHKALNYQQTHTEPHHYDHSAKDGMYNMRASFVKNDYREDDIMHIDPPQPSLYLLGSESSDIVYYRKNLFVGDWSYEYKPATGNLYKYYFCTAPATLISQDSGLLAPNNSNNQFPYDENTFPFEPNTINNNTLKRFFHTLPGTKDTEFLAVVNQVPSILWSVSSKLFPKLVKRDTEECNGSGSYSHDDGNYGSGSGTCNYDPCYYVPESPTYNEYALARTMEDWFIEFPLTTIYGMRYIAVEFNVGYFDNQAKINDGDRYFHNLLKEHPHRIIRSNLYSSNFTNPFTNKIVDVYDTTIEFNSPITVNNLGHSFHHLFYLQYYSRPVAGFIKDPIYQGIQFEEFPDSNLPREESVYISDLGEISNCDKTIAYTNDQDTALDPTNNVGIGGILKIHTFPQLSTDYQRTQKLYPLSKYLKDPDKKIEMVRDSPTSSTYSILNQPEFIEYEIDEYGIASNGVDNRMPIIFTKDLLTPTVLRECLWINTNINTAGTDIGNTSDPSATSPEIDVAVKRLLIEGYNTYDEDNIWRPIEILTFKQAYYTYLLNAQISYFTHYSFNGRVTLSYHRLVNRLRFTVLSIQNHNRSLNYNSYDYVNGYQPFKRVGEPSGNPAFYIPVLNMRYKSIYIPELIFF